MRLTIIVLALSLLFHACFIAGNKKASKTFHAARGYCDSTEAENIFGCILEFEAQPEHEKWLKFLQNNLQLDSVSVDSIPAGTFVVLAQFVIDKKGKLTNVTIIKDPGYGLGKKVKEIMEQYNGQWKPAQVNGHEVYSSRRQPITFIIEEETESICEGKQSPDLIL